MRWIFAMVEETEEKYVYRYARESDELDGMIEYDKEQKTVAMIKPCANDLGSEWCINKAIGKFVSFVAGEGFPNTRKVITG